MARRVVMKVTDDIDGSELEVGKPPTTFSLNGTDYEIDLSAANAEKLTATLDPYIAGARRVAAKRQRRSTGQSGNKERNRRIRQWARDNGHRVSSRGQIASGIIRAFEEANPGE